MELTVTALIPAPYAGLTRARRAEAAAADGSEAEPDVADGVADAVTEAPEP